jgi:hypothetical protein
MEREAVLNRYFDDNTAEKVGSEGWIMVGNKSQLWRGK